MPVRNEGARVKDAINSFIDGRSTQFPVEFIVVDDASQDGCCDDLEYLLSADKYFVQVHVLRLNSWSGIPSARNQGAALVRAPVMVITDANVEACAGWDVPIFKNLKPGVVLCATIADIGSQWRGYGCVLDLNSMGVNWSVEPNAFGGYAPISPCTGTVLHTELFKRTGGFDTAMPVYGAAEPEFSVRLWLYGSVIRVCPDLVLMHRFRPAEERRPFLEQIEFIQTRNYLRFGLLYLDEMGIVRLLEHWIRSANTNVAEALQEVVAGGVWRRRIHLRANLLRSFEWYKTFFGLT
jgi:glycosyltransferase involved in cell wall biosynthesis